MPEHTPGPWYVEDHSEGDDRGIFYMQGADGKDLPDTEANLNCISAAPEMLAALESIADSDFVRDAIGTGNLQGVYAAIAKAKGGVGMEAKHTPGPWEIQTWDAGQKTLDYYIVIDDEESIIAWVSRVPNQCYPNATTIAAAPEMLDALEASLLYFGPASDNFPIKKQIRAAIAKAKGGNTVTQYLKCSECETEDRAVMPCAQCHMPICLEHRDRLSSRDSYSDLMLCQPCGDRYDADGGVEMTEAKHTEGPWRMDDTDGIITVHSRDDEIAIMSGPTTDVERGNASRMAASLEMLAVLERIDAQDIIPHYWTTVQDMKAVIAKAKGE